MRVMELPWRIDGAHRAFGTLDARMAARRR
jgi:hypothetical protein